MPTKVLTKELIFQIAAGEMVETLVSIVKELADNLLDTSSSQISIEVRGK